ncbi:hypothetical protein M565_ctg1P1655 [Vibrio cyclitrophicus FF75]|nr:hypothetical protein M565_ctg1P1655 [Vibrio cyclitrophicus FF75]
MDLDSKLNLKENSVIISENLGVIVQNTAILSNVRVLGKT